MRYSGYTDLWLNYLLTHSLRRIEIFRRTERVSAYDVREQLNHVVLLLYLRRRLHFDFFPSVGDDFALSLQAKRP